MRIRLGYSNVLYLCVCFSAVANASPEEERAMAAPRLQAEEARNSVREIAEGLKNEPYFDQAKLALVFARLESAKNSRRYETADPVKFAQLVTEDMQAASKDTHLYLSFNPGWYRSAVAPEDPARTAEQNAYEENIARITNFGLSETRILTGNVRYLRIDGFSWIEKEAVPTFDAVIDFLKGGRAIIIDVRNNRGGDTNALYYLMGHFFKPDDLMLTWIAPGKPDMQVRASPFLRSSLVGIPTYVLVNARSRSAAEALAWTVKQFKIGDVVGETTEGAAHPSNDVAIKPFFRLSIPTARTEDPISRSDWEGVGVSPTIPAASSDALAAAYGRAVEKLLGNTEDEEQRAFLVWAKDGITAQEQHFQPDNAYLAGLAGDYGSVKVAFRQQALWLDRKDRLPLKLKSLGSPGIFEAEDDPMLRVRFDVDALELVQLGQQNPTRFVR